MIDLAVEEQRSLGEELHDTLSQQIHGLTMLAQSLVQNPPRASDDTGCARWSTDSRTRIARSGCCRVGWCRCASTPTVSRARWGDGAGVGAAATAPPACSSTRAEATPTTSG